MQTCRTPPQTLSVRQDMDQIRHTNDEEHLVRFLHLSDIHFADCDGSPDTDLESTVRERMLEDIQKMHGQLGDMTAFLVVGDIAARGKRADYDVAAALPPRSL